jgi:PncC family amidohydrolase
MKYDDMVFYSDEAMPELPLEEKLYKLAIEKECTISVAESCTGGLLSGQIINVSGASNIFLEGDVTYSNDAKMKSLGVSEKSLEEFGAVSDIVAMEMAKGIQKKTGSTFAVSTTGIAGPEGGTSEKPVGLVYFGFASEKESFAKRRVFTGDRKTVRRKAVEEALKILISEIEKLQ